MIASTTCDRAMHECIGLAGFDALLVLALCIAGAVLIIITASVLYKRLGGGRPRVWEIHEHRHEDPSVVALNHARTIDRLQVVEARQRILDAHTAPAELDPLSTAYDQWLAGRRKELGR